MIALNEEALIGECLKSVRGVVDEIVLGLDTRTTDRTGPIARGHGARIIPVEWRDDFSYARNLVIDASRGEWILVLDADDRLTPAGMRAVRHVVQTNGAVDVDALARSAADQGITLGANCITGYMFELAEHNLDGTHRCTWLGSHRLFRREAGIRYYGRVHEEPRRPSTSMEQGTAWAILPGGPHISHLGNDPRLRELRAKDERNLRLAKLRVVDDPTAAVAHYQLTRAAYATDNQDLARVHARRALDLIDSEDCAETRLLRTFLTFGTMDESEWRRDVGGRDRESQLRTVMNRPSGPLPMLDFGAA